MSALLQAIESHKTVGENICHRLIAETAEAGFIPEQLDSLPAFEQAEFSLQKDPFTLDDNLTGVWFNQNRHRIGQIQFLSDGSFYAEYDVIKPHPTKTKWFVEAITAWGKPDSITAEPKLLPIAE